MLGKYTIEKEIGSGSLAAVYEVYKTDSRQKNESGFQKLALKAISLNHKEIDHVLTALEEIRVLSTCNTSLNNPGRPHPNIVEFVEAFVTENGEYLW